ncbi:lung adenoma susceptibility protein 2 [Corythoichthys intestinalis]|uniref:lung adenoma susceptibility protein 2 n=1 Tax=Corythoichthys intestinalis TaxID=161448 RepID=UPI0025A62BEC|nr:lung adenoma susceptibility protein 2 [Corythoichthys intestinalis]
MKNDGTKSYTIGRLSSSLALKQVKDEAMQSMDPTSPVSDFVSPESTVTTLLSSSGHFKSRLSPEFNTTFRYRDKEYDSASEALDAYIIDFDRSRNIESSGRLVLPQSPLSTPRRPRISTRRNKSVLREHLTDREVDFLTLPVSSLRHRDNHDRLSMTTDELLSIPRDGSMPVTHTTAFIQGHLSQSAASQAYVSSTPLNRAKANISHQHSSKNCSSCRCIREAEVPTLKQDVPFVRCLTCAHRAARSEQASSPVPHSHSRVNCNLADLNCSRTSYVPAVIQDCDTREPPPPSEVYFYDKLELGSRVPSWLADTEDDPCKTPIRVKNQCDTKQSLRDLRFQFAEQISLIASERKSADITESLFKDNRLESLIQKADQVLNSLSQSFGGEGSTALSVCRGSMSPVNSDEIQLGSTSHDPLLPADSTGAEKFIIEALSKETMQTWDCSDGQKLPGALEALKQMMFRLQAVEAELHRKHVPIAPTCSKETQKKPENEVELSLSGAPSIKRALHHLSRLKLLLEEPRVKHAEEERDTDEGRYSSSSADRLMLQLSN